MTDKELMSTDLMVGDWVNVTHEDETFQGRVASIDGDTEDVKVSLCSAPYGWEDGDDFDKIEPIHLTPEILEKNGFVTNDEQGNWKGYRIYSLFNTDKSCIFMLKLYEKDSICEISLDMSPYYIVFKFVHELHTH